MNKRCDNRCQHDHHDNQSYLTKQQKPGQQAYYLPPKAQRSPKLHHQKPPLDHQLHLPQPTVCLMCVYVQGHRENARVQNHQLEDFDGNHSDAGHTRSRHNGTGVLGVGPCRITTASTCSWLCSTRSIQRTTPPFQ